MVSRIASSFLAAAFVVGGAHAQVAKGNPAPAFPFQKVWNDGPASFGDFPGKVVILKFSETW